MDLFSSPRAEVCIVAYVVCFSYNTRTYTLTIKNADLQLQNVSVKYISGKQLSAVETLNSTSLIKSPVEKYSFLNSWPQICRSIVLSWVTTIKRIHTVFTVFTLSVVSLANTALKDLTLAKRTEQRHFCVTSSRDWLSHFSLGMLLLLSRLEMIHKAIARLLRQEHQRNRTHVKTAVENAIRHRQRHGCTRNHMNGFQFIFCIHVAQNDPLLCKYAALETASYPQRPPGPSLTDSLIGVGEDADADRRFNPQIPSKHHLCTI